MRTGGIGGGAAAAAVRPRADGEPAATVAVVATVLARSGGSHSGRERAISHEGLTG